jgi:hypothetical protein
MCVQERITACLAEALEEKGVADELLQMWAGSEDRIFSPDAQWPLEAGIDPTMRALVLNFGQEVAHKSECPSSCFLQMVQLFDAAAPHMVKSHRHNDPISVFSCAAASWSLSFKISGDAAQNLHNLDLHNLAAMVSSFSRMYNVRDLDAGDIERAEVELLVLFNFNPHTVAVDTWIQTYMLRLQVLGMISGSQMEYALPLCNWWTTSLICSAPVRAVCPPRMLARGILGLVLAAFQILPIQGLCLNEVFAVGLAAQAQQLLAITKARLSASPAGSALAKQLQDMPRKQLPPKAVQAAIQFATQSKELDIQDHMVVAANMLRSALWN